MGDRQLVVRRWQSRCTAALVVLLMLPPQHSIAAEYDHNIRFYKANKILQTSAIRFLGSKRKTPGCHNFLKQTRVYKIVQIGFAYCETFSQKDCSEESRILANRKKEQSIDHLTEGYAWFPIGSKPQGAKTRSWRCVEKSTDS